MLPLLPGHYCVARRWGQSRCYKAIGWSGAGKRIAHMRDVTNVMMLMMVFRESFVERWGKREKTLRLLPYDKKRNFWVDLLLGRPRLQCFASAEEARQKLRRQQQQPDVMERVAEHIAHATLSWICRRPRWVLISLFFLTSPLYWVLSPSVLIERLSLRERTQDH